MTSQAAFACTDGGLFLLEPAANRLGPGSRDRRAARRSGLVTRRPAPNFHEFMSGMMDARAESAIGGNACEHFVMTVDYPRAVAYFRCVHDCR